jgi:hypothetical protein
MQVFFITSFYSEAVLWLEKNLLTCPSKKLFHLDCPGCGLQRSYVALLKGDVTASFQLYPAAIPIFILFIFLALHLIVKFEKGALILTRLYILSAIIILVHYIYKIVTNQLF